MKNVIYLTLITLTSFIFSQEENVENPDTLSNEIIEPIKTFYSTSNLQYVKKLQINILPRITLDNHLKENDTLIINTDKGTVNIKSEFLTKIAGKNRYLVNESNKENKHIPQIEINNNPNNIEYIIISNNPSNENKYIINHKTKIDYGEIDFDLTDNYIYNYNKSKSNILPYITLSQTKSNLLNRGDLITLTIDKSATWSDNNIDDFYSSFFDILSLSKNKKELTLKTKVDIDDNIINIKNLKFDINVKKSFLLKLSALVQFKNSNNVTYEFNKKVKVGDVQLINNGKIAQIPIFPNTDTVEINNIHILNEHISGNTFLNKNDNITISLKDKTSILSYDEYKIETTKKKLKLPSISISNFKREELIEDNLEIYANSAESNYVQKLYLSNPKIFHKGDIHNLYFEYDIDQYAIPVNPYNEKGSVQNGDTLFINVPNTSPASQLNLEELEDYGYKRIIKNNNNKDNQIVMEYTSRRSLKFDDLDAKVYYKTKQIIREIRFEFRSTNNNDLNYTLKNYLNYSNIKFDIKDPKIYVATIGNINTLPQISITQEGSYILKKDDIISLILPSEEASHVIWNKKQTINSDYLHLKSLDEDKNILHFIVQKDINKKSINLSNLSFVINDNSSFNFNLTASIKTKSNQWNKNNYKINNYLKAGNVNVNFISRVPIFTDDNYALIELIEIADKDITGKNSILHKGDKIRLLPLNYGNILTNTFDLTSNNENIKIKNKKIKINNHKEILNEKLKFELIGLNGFTQKLDFKHSSIFHIGEKRDLYYDSALTEFTIPIKKIKNNKTINKDDIITITFDQENLHKINLKMFEDNGFNIVSSPINSNDKYTYKLKYNSRRSKTINTLIGEIKFNRTDFINLPKTVTVKVRSSDPSSFNYTLINYLKYAEINLEFSDKYKGLSRFTSITDSVYTMPTISLKQYGYNHIIKKNDQLILKLDKNCEWSSKTYESFYSEDFNKPIISSDKKRITLTFNKDINKDDLQIENLFFILKEKIHHLYITGEIKSYQGYWQKNNYKLKNNDILKFGDITNIYISKVPIFKNQKYVEIDTIALRDNHPNNEQHILKKKDKFIIDDLDFGKIESGKHYDVKYNEEQIIWKNIKIKINDPVSIINENIKVRLEGMDGYKQDIELNQSNIFHEAHRRVVHYDNTMNQFQLPRIPFTSKEDINEGDLLYIYFSNPQNGHPDFSHIEDSGYKLLKNKTINNKEFTFIFNNRNGNTDDIDSKISYKKLNKYNLPKNIRYEFRSKKKNGYNYTFEYIVKYASITFNISNSKRFSNSNNTKNIMPNILLYQEGKDKIIKSGDQILISFKEKDKNMWVDNAYKYEDEHLVIDRNGTDNETLIFNVKKDIDKEKYIFKDLSFKNKTDDSYDIKLIGEIISNNTSWKNKGYIINSDGLTIGNTKYSTSQITGIVRSRPTNICPKIVINEDTKSITYKNDTIIIELITNTESFSDLSWYTEKIKYNKEYLNHNKQKSINSKIYFDVVKDFPSGDSDNALPIVIDGLRVNKIDTEIDTSKKVFINITNTSEAHKELNKKNLKFMSYTNPYLSFVYDNNIMFANDYADKECTVINHDQVNVKLMNTPSIPTFWEDDKILVYLPPESGAKWLDSFDNSGRKHFILNFNDELSQFSKGNCEDCKAYLSNNNSSSKPNSEFELSYILTNNISSLNDIKSVKKQDHYHTAAQKTKLPIIKKYFYNTIFDLQDDLYIHQDVDNNKHGYIPFKDIIVKNLPNINQLYNKDCLVGFSFDNKSKLKFYETSTQNNNLVNVCNNTEDDIFSLDFLKYSNKHIIQNNFITKEDNHNLDFGKTISYPLNIKIKKIDADNANKNYYFKTSNQIFIAHPEISTTPVKITWPNDALKTGKVVINSLNTGFKDYNKLYVKIDVQDNSKIKWSKTQPFDNFYIDKNNDKIIEIDTNNKDRISFEYFLFDGLNNFTDIPYDKGLRFNILFSFDGINYVKRNAISTSENKPYKNDKVYDLDIQRLGGINIVNKSNKPIEYLSYDSNSKIYHLPKLNIIENNNRSLLFKGTKILLKIDTKDVNWTTEISENSLWHTESIDNYTLRLTLKENIKDNLKIIPISGLSLRKKTTFTSFNITATIDTENGKDKNIIINDQLSYSVIGSNIVAYMENSKEERKSNFIYSIRDNPSYNDSNEPKNNILPNIVFDNKTLNKVLSGNDNIYIKFPFYIDNNSKIIEKDPRFKIEDEQTLIINLTSEENKLFKIPEIKFFYPKDVIIENNVKYQITNEYQNFNEDNYNEFNEKITVTTGQPFIFYNTLEKFIINGEPIKFPNITINEDPYLEHIKAGSTLRLELKEEYGIKWDECQIPNKDDYFNYSIDQKTPRILNLKAHTTLGVSNKTIIKNLYIYNFNNKNKLIQLADDSSNLINIDLFSNLNQGDNIKNNKNNPQSDIMLCENYGYKPLNKLKTSNKNNGIFPTELSISFQDNNPLNFQQSNIIEISGGVKIDFDDIDTLPEYLFLTVITLDDNGNPMIDVTADKEYVWDIDFDTDKSKPYQIITGEYSTQSVKLLIRINKNKLQNGEPIVLKGNHFRISAEGSAKIDEGQFKISLEPYNIHNECISTQNIVYNRTNKRIITETTEDICSDVPIENYKYIKKGQEVSVVITPYRETINSSKNKYYTHSIYFEKDYEIKPSLKKTDGTTVGKIINTTDPSILTFELSEDLTPNGKYEIDNLLFRTASNAAERNSGNLHLVLGQKNYYPKNNGIEHIRMGEHGFNYAIDKNNEDIYFSCIFYPTQNFAVWEDNNTYKIRFQLKEKDDRKEALVDHIESIHAIFKKDTKENKLTRILTFDQITWRERLITKLKEVYGNKHDYTEQGLLLINKVDENDYYHLVLSALYSIKGGSFFDKDTDWAEDHFNKYMSISNQTKEEAEKAFKEICHEDICSQPGLNIEGEMTNLANANASVKEIDEFIYKWLLEEEKDLISVINKMKKKKKISEENILTFKENYKNILKEATTNSFDSFYAHTLKNNWKFGNNINRKRYIDKVIKPISNKMFNTMNTAITETNNKNIYKDNIKTALIFKTNDPTIDLNNNKNNSSFLNLPQIELVNYEPMRIELISSNVYLGEYESSNKKQPPLYSMSINNNNNWIERYDTGKCDELNEKKCNDQKYYNQCKWNEQNKKCKGAKRDNNNYRVLVTDDITVNLINEATYTLLIDNPNKSEEINKFNAPLTLSMVAILVGAIGSK